MIPWFDGEIYSLEWKEALLDKYVIRAAIQGSQATNAALSRELGINVKAVAKWRKRETLEDRKTGPTEPSSTVLSTDEEAMVVAFRRHTLLPRFCCEVSTGRRERAAAAGLRGKFRELAGSESSRDLTFADHVRHFNSVQRCRC